ncbi:MAG TPA: class II aldolase/adducin family protein [Bryobacteraceae bacterium]|nr:class II aldolase/adducin family protein [Bryobacteraceae bacterium]
MSRSHTTLACALLCAFVVTVFAQDKKTSGASSAKALIDELVIANHILANEGVVDAYGHVSIRNPANPQHLFLARHMAAGVVTASDIIEYDLDCNPLSAGASAGYTERFIHCEIYRARPDVMAVVHAHSPDVIPFTVSSIPLKPVYHMAGFISDGLPTFDIRKASGQNTDMLIRNADLGRKLAQTLAKKPAALMRGHGAVIVAESLHVVAGRAYYLNMNARLQREAMALGGPVTYLTREEADLAGAQDGFERAWDLWRSKVK